MQMITWVILPVLCVIAVAVYLYRKVKAAVKCFLPAYSLKRQRIFAGIISLLLIIPAVRIYGMWFIILLHFTVFLLLLDAVVFLIKKLKKQNQLTGLWNITDSSSDRVWKVQYLSCSQNRVQYSNSKEYS